MAASLLAGTCVVSATVRPAKLTGELTKLANGLTAVLLEDHTTPIVHVQVWYHVGSKDERPGRTGFAHLFEHLMFKGSKNVEPDQHASMIAAVGGLANAYTTEDVTVYWETLPAQYLPLALWLEADRMASLRITRPAFERERQVVEEERRMRFDNQPYGSLPELIYGSTFSTHPYRHTPLGSLDDLSAASEADVRDFYRTYYVPANATLAIVGDFDTATALDLVNRYLGRVPKSDRSIARHRPTEPAQQQERRVTVRRAWPLPVVVVAYHVPGDGHPDAYPLQLASTLLSDGQSSRIYRALVYEGGLALTAFGGGQMREDPSLFFAVAVVQPGRAPAEAEQALVAELDRLREDPVSEPELERAKNQFARDTAVARESDQQKATQLAHAAVLHQGDVTAADREYDGVMSATAEAVRRVARTYFVPQNRTIITVLPADAAR